MKWLNTAWRLVRDVLVTGTGLVLIVMQALRPVPSTEVLLTALTLTVPSAASHVIALLSGPSGEEHGQPGSSPPSASHGAPASPSSSSPQG